MKSLLYIIILFVCAWIIIEPKDTYEAQELPEVQLQDNEQPAISNPEIDTIITNIEKNLNYLNNTKITDN